MFLSILLFRSLSIHSMSHSSSSHTAPTATESGHTASLSRHPTLDSDEEPMEDTESEHEVSSERPASIPSPTPTTTFLPSPLTHQGLIRRQTARMSVRIPERVSLGTSSNQTLIREMAPRPSPPVRSEYHLGGPSSSSDPAYSTAQVSDRYRWQNYINHTGYPTGFQPDLSRCPNLVTGVPVGQESGMTLEELERMQRLAAEVRDCRIGVEYQAQLLLEFSEMAGRLTQQVTRALGTADEAREISYRAWYLCLFMVTFLLILVLVLAVMIVFRG